MLAPYDTCQCCFGTGAHMRKTREILCAECWEFYDEADVVATHTYMDGDKVVIREITPEEFYLPGPVNVTPSFDAERTKVSSQASSQDRVEPKQEINPSNGDEQP